MCILLALSGVHMQAAIRKYRIQMLTPTNALHNVNPAVTHTHTHTHSLIHTHTQSQLTTSFHPFFLASFPLGTWRWHVSLSRTVETTKQGETVKSQRVTAVYFTLIIVQSQQASFSSLTEAQPVRYRSEQARIVYYCRQVYSWCR